MTEPAQTEPVPTAKVDPETLVLRAKPRRIIRIKRNVLIGMAGAGCVVLVGLVWLGLGPAVIQGTPATVADRDPEKHKMGLPDQVSSLPKSYADVPQLGAPLPGDLGRPILEHQRAHGMDTSAGAVATGPAPGATRSDGGADARTSGLFFQVTSGATPVSGTGVGAPGTAANDLNPSLMALPLPAVQTVPLAEKVSFLESASRSDVVDRHVVQAPPPANTVMAGTVISAALITGLNSDLPGTVLAQVTSDVHDSLSGRLTLIPQGTRLIGQYDTGISFGQSRALIVWLRLIWPDGRSLEIENTPTSDLAGLAGLSDGVSFHTGSLLKGIGLSTLLGLSGELGRDSDSDLVKALRQSVQETANQAGQKIVSRELGVQPTLTVRPGWPVRVIVQRDLIVSTGGADD